MGGASRNEPPFAPYSFHQSTLFPEMTPFLQSGLLLSKEPPFKRVAQKTNRQKASSIERIDPNIHPANETAGGRFFAHFMLHQKTCRGPKDDLSAARPRPFLGWVAQPLLQGRGTIGKEGKECPSKLRCRARLPLRRGDKAPILCLVFPGSAAEDPPEGRHQLLE